MSVAILFDADIKNGGSYHMSINNLLELKKNFNRNNLNCVILTHESNSELERLNINYQIIKITFFDYIFLLLRNIILINNIIIRLNLSSAFEKKLLKKNISLVIFLFISYKSYLLKKIKFTSAVLDVCHRDFPYFKEVRGIVYLVREYLNKNILPLSSLVITDSDFLKKKIVNFYNLNSNSIISIPYIPSSLIVNNKNISLRYIKKKYNIKNSFFFYPAQFWYHKNHIIILKAVKKLKERKININCIFCGRDKGNLKFIRNKILEYGISKNVKIFDYLKDKEVFAFYKICKALIMPTYFGPTNMPPVEAWYLDVPVVYSSNLKNHGKNAALYFNPNSVDELIQALKSLDSGEIKKKLIQNGRKRLKEIIEERNSGISLFVKKIKNLIK